MNIRNIFLAMSILAAPCAMADEIDTAPVPSASTEGITAPVPDASASGSIDNEFLTNESNHEGGFLTDFLNEAISKGMESTATVPSASPEGQGMEVGRKVTDYVSAPKFGGYYMSGYYYSSKEGAHSGDGFKQKNVRAYVSGTIFKDFSYLMQVQIANDKFHMKDYWLEWKKYSEFQIKGGQFIRVFGYENPYNPFEYHDGAYAQITQQLCGQADYVGEDNGGGRDQGIQIQGDLFPAKDGHRFLHYQFMVSNGQTINSADKNSQKDLSGMIAIQPIPGLRIAAWGWTGNFTGSNGVTVDRDRYMFSVFYDKDDWTFRTEYAHSTGHSVLAADGNGGFTDKGKQQGWYAALGIPCNAWLKTWLKYDSYERDASVETMKSIYSVAPNIQLHKNLWFQPRVAYVHDRNLAKDNRNYWELSCEMGVRF